MGRTVRQQSESGVSLIEVMISAFILTVAMLGVASTMVRGISSLYYTQEQLIAKQKAREALESVFTARSTQNIVFNQIQNTTTTPGIFLAGFQPLKGMGADGIANTADDGNPAVETLNFPGPDGLLGTSDDEIIPLTNFERKITISEVLDSAGAVDPDIRKITVEVRFRANSVWQSFSISSLISKYA